MSTALTPSPLLWTLRSIARIERRGDFRPARLTEPGLTRWNRMKRKLGFVDLIALLHEDLADAFPFPFDLARWGTRPLDALDEDTARSLVESAIADDNSAPQLFVRAAALALGLPVGGNSAALPKVQPHHGEPALLGTMGLTHWLSGLYERARGDRHRLIVLAVPGGVHDNRVRLNERYNLPYTPDMAAVYLDDVA